MGRKVPIDRLSAEVEKILNDYGENVQQNLGEIVKQMSKKGAQTLRSQSKGTFKGTGEYAKGWTSRAETGRISAQGTIYNKDVPGLPHLLEHGHANRGGGRTPGREHIKPVEEALIKEFEQKVKSKL
jgi:hypothetical protein